MIGKSYIKKIKQLGLICGFLALGISIWFGYQQNFPLEANQQNSVMTPHIYLPYLFAGDDQQSSQPVRRVNVPYHDTNEQPPFSEGAIFWFGQVKPTENYADVRVNYNNEALHLAVHIFDRLLWYDESPSVEDLTNWDAVSLYLNLDGNIGNLPTTNSYRFIAQLNHYQPRSDYQAAYQGNGTDWIFTSTPFETEAGWRGEGLNNGAEARGWHAVFTIPYSSLGLTSPPQKTTKWGLAVAVHDRDDAQGSLIPDQIWPESIDVQRPSSWGELHFGLVSHQVPPTIIKGTTTIRHGLNGVSVADGHVGGHTTCAENLYPNYFDTWGAANYDGFELVNIQNQWDVADWPCFSKYYITFPLDSLPADKTLVSATFSQYMTGSAGTIGPPPEDSLIQILTLTEDWQEPTLTWNNAPLAKENVASTWVEPVEGFPGWPGIRYEWDITRAVTEAYEAGEPLRLAIYSADYAQNSGKYFVSSDIGDWNAEGRPTLKIEWG